MRVRVGVGAGVRVNVCTQFWVDLSMLGVEIPNAQLIDAASHERELHRQ